MSPWSMFLLKIRRALFGNREPQIRRQVEWTNK